MKTNQINTVQGHNNFQNVLVCSPKKSERSPQIKFVRKPIPTCHKNFVSHKNQDGINNQTNNISPRRSYKGSDVESFAYNPQQTKYGHMRQQTSGQNLLHARNSGKQYKPNIKQNQPTNAIYKKWQRIAENPTPKRSFNIEKVKQIDSKELIALRQEISAQKKEIQKIRTTSKSKEKQSLNKYKELQNQYQSALQKIRKLEESQNYNKAKLKKHSTAQIHGELRAKSVKLESDILDLQEKYNKKMEECKYHQIQIGMLRKRRDQMKNSQLKLLTLTQKNKELSRRVQSIKKQLIHVNSCKNVVGVDFVKRKDSSDSLFDLSSDQSVDHRQRLF